MVEEIENPILSGRDLLGELLNEMDEAGVDEDDFARMLLEGIYGLNDNFIVPAARLLLVSADDDRQEIRDAIHALDQILHPIDKADRLQAWRVLLELDQPEE